MAEDRARPRARPSADPARGDDLEPWPGKRPGTMTAKPSGGLDPGKHSVTQDLKRPARAVQVEHLVAKARRDLQRLDVAIAAPDFQTAAIASIALARALDDLRGVVQSRPELDALIQLQREAAPLLAAAPVIGDDAYRERFRTSGKPRPAWDAAERAWLASRGVADRVPAAVRDALAAEPGTPLPDAAAWSQRIGADVGHAKIVTGDRAAAAAAALGVRAFVVGDRVFLGAGHDAATDGGDLLAHELVHVAQQRGAGAPTATTDLPLLAHGDPREVAARAHDGDAATSELAIAADTGQGASSAPDLSDKEPYRWISGTYSLWVLTAWIKTAPDLTVDKGRWVVPSKLAELLKELRRKGMLSWVTDDVIRSASTELDVEPQTGKVFQLNLNINAFSPLGLPSKDPMIAFTAGGGLVIALPLPDVKAAFGTKIELSTKHKEALVGALEAFTKLPMLPDKRSTILAASISEKIGRGVVDFTVSRDLLETLFGKEAYTKFVDGRGATNQPGIGAPGGAQAVTDLKPDELAFVQLWLKTHLKAGGKDAVPVVMSRMLYDALKRIEAADDKTKAKFIELLTSGKKTGDDNGLITADVIDRVIHQAAFEIEREAAGFDKLKHDGVGRDPTFDIEVPARLDQRNGLVMPGEQVQFSVEVDWPTAYTADQDWDYKWRPMIAEVDWFFERHWPDDGYKRLQNDPYRHTITDDAGKATTDYKFALDTWENAGLWTVHAYVRHSLFRPAILTTEVEVKTEKARLDDLRQETYAQVGNAPIAEPDHDFSTTWFNETFGSSEYHKGLVFRGELPKGFAGRTTAEREAEIASEISRYEKLLEYLKRDKQKAAIDACEHYLAKLRDAQETMHDDIAEKWQPFELFGFYLGSGNRVFDGALTLYGTFRQTKVHKVDPGQGAGAPPPPGHDEVTGVEVQIRDLSRRIDQENYRFKGSGATFEAALEEAFIHLCKKYPEGKVSVQAQAFDAHADKATGKTIGFELATGTAWKDVKATLWDPMVDKIVNIGAAILMIIFPETIPILLPLMIAYNEIPNIDSFVDEVQTGSLTKGKAFLHLFQLGMDLLPVAGKLPVFKTSKVAFSLFEVANWGGQVVMMDLQVQQRIAELRDNDIAGMAKLYEDYVKLQNSTQASDPRLKEQKKKLDEQAEKIRGEAQTAWKDALKDFAVLALPGHFAHALDHHLTSKKVDTLHDRGRYTHVDGVDPHYDPTTGRIVGDRGKLNRATLDHLQEQQNAHMREVAGKVADELGVARDKVDMEPGDANRIHKDGNRVRIEYKPGTDPNAAMKEWKAQGAAAKIGGGRKPVKAAPEAHAPPARPDVRVVEPDLANDEVSPARETTAAAVPGSSFKGRVRAADPVAVHKAAHEAFEGTARAVKGVKGVEKLTSEHLNDDPGEKARTDDTYLITVDGAAIAVRVIAAPVEGDHVARTVVNPTKVGGVRTAAHPEGLQVKGRYVVQLSDKIDPANAARAIAHEIREIVVETELSRAGRAPGPDVLGSGPLPPHPTLSPHDAGRVAEIEQFAAKVLAHDEAAIGELTALVEHLGLRDGTPGADVRRALVEAELGRTGKDALAAVAKPETALDVAQRQRLQGIRDAAKADLAKPDAQPKVALHEMPDAKPAKGQLVTADHAHELALQAQVARARKSADTVAAVQRQPKVKRVQIGGGAALSAREPDVLLIDARGRWQADASERIAQTANQLRGLVDAGVGDPFQFAAPDERVPLSAIRFWEDSIAAQGPVIDGTVVSIEVDAHGVTRLEIKAQTGETVKIEVEGDVVIASGFPPERLPGTPFGMTPDGALRDTRQALRAIADNAADPRHERAKHVLAALEPLDAIESEPGKRASDLAKAWDILRHADFEDEVPANVRDMMAAGVAWERTQREHPNRVFLGDAANLQSMDPKLRDKWVVGGIGGSGVSAVEIILKGNDRAHVTMMGDRPTPGLLDNNQFMKILEDHADPQTRAWVKATYGVELTSGGSGRFTIVAGVRVGLPHVDEHGKVHAAKGGDFLPAGYDEAHNPTIGDAYVSGIGREGQFPPAAAAFVERVERAGGNASMEMLYDAEEHYLGYRLHLKDAAGKELRKIDVTGAASRFPPWDYLRLPNAEKKAAQSKFAAASDHDAPPESGGFNAGFTSSATQGARYARDQKAKRDATGGGHDPSGHGPDPRPGLGRSNHDGHEGEYVASSPVTLAGEHHHVRVNRLDSGEHVVTLCSRCQRIVNLANGAITYLKELVANPKGRGPHHVVAPKNAAELVAKMEKLHGDAKTLEEKAGTMKPDALQRATEEMASRLQRLVDDNPVLAPVLEVGSREVQPIGVDVEPVVDLAMGDAAMQGGELAATWVTREQNHKSDQLAGEIAKAAIDATAKDVIDVLRGDHAKMSGDDFARVEREVRRQVALEYIDRLADGVDQAIAARRDEVGKRSNDRELAAAERVDKAIASARAQVVRDLAEPWRYTNAGEFETKAANSGPPGERVAFILPVAVERATFFKLSPAPENIARLNKTRTIYIDAKGKLLYSVDTEKGRFEVCDAKTGRHQREINFDGAETAGQDPEKSHDLKVR